MGRKYASYHIPNNEKSDDLESLKEIYNVKSADKNQYEQAAEVFTNPIARDMMNRFLSIYKNTVNVIITERFISVYDSALSFGTINEETKRFSKKIRAPIFYVSNFDDDVLLLGCVQSGKTIARKHIGQGLTEYGIQPIKSTIHLLPKLEGFSFLKSGTTFETTDSISECEASIECEFQIYLAMPFEDVQAQPNYIRLVDDNDTLKIYRYMNVP